MPEIVVLDGRTLNPGDNPWTDLESLGQLTVYDRTPPDQIVSRVGESPIVVTNKVPLSASTIDQLPSLKFIAVTATGVNVVDLNRAAERDIPVSNVPAYSTHSVAQHVFAMLLSFLNQPQEHHNAVVAGQWQRCGDFSFWLSPLSELAGKTMGVFGYGRIGEAVSRIALAMGMNVIAVSRSQQGGLNDSNFRWGSESELLELSDVISLHCPLTEATENLVDRTWLNQMKTTAILINTARGGLVCEGELAAALQEHRIRGALLDVTRQEPIESNNPLLTAPHCLITPHIAWATVEARKRAMSITVDNVRAFLDGTPIHRVN